MEYWEITKARAQQTSPIWQGLLAQLKINGVSVDDYEALFAEFEPLAQARVLAQDGFDAGYRAVQGALLKMKILGTRVPMMIQAQLDENEGLMEDVDDLFATNPRTESTILKRARELYPVWVRANTALAAHVPALPPLIRPIAGAQHTAVMLKALLDDFTDLVAAMGDKEEILNQARTAMRTLDAQVDRLNKNFYKYVKGTYDPGSAPYDALSGIDTEPSTPPPEVIEIATVAQGGEDGLQVLVAYEPGGGAHATTRAVEWTLPGDAQPFQHTAPLDASGNALGPFAVGQTITVRTLVSNSVATRTTLPRTITVEEAIL